MHLQLAPVALHERAERGFVARRRGGDGGLVGLFHVRVTVPGRGNHRAPDPRYASSAATSSTEATAPGVVRKLTKHARRHARPSTLAGAR